MYKKNKIVKVKNPTQIKVCKYPNDMNIDIFEVCGRGGDFNNRNYLDMAYRSSNRKQLFADLITIVNNGFRICLKKI